MPNVTIVFGTRPEAIKMAPVVTALRAQAGLDVTVCTTGQHREMLDQVLDFFEITPDVRLDAMAGKASLGNLTARLLVGLEEQFETLRPDLVLVHGDTATTMAASLAAYYVKAAVGHVEAGLRTNDKFAPWPEEMNRKITGALSDLHFAPTDKAKANLLAEGVDERRIFVTGNTVIDALQLAAAQLDRSPEPAEALAARFPQLRSGRRLILVTGHRRENFGEGMRTMCEALRKLADRTDCWVLYPVHLNPNVQEPVLRILGGHPNIQLCEPLDYIRFVHLLRSATLVITDSGGIQEEAPGFGKPVLVTRTTTERPEAVERGVAMLVGTDTGRIVREATRLLDDEAAYRAMATATNPFGDGRAARRITEQVSAWFAERQHTHANSFAGA